MLQKFDALPVWREEICRGLLGLDFKPLADVPFSATIQPIFANNDIKVVRWNDSPGVTFRDEQLVKDGDDSFALVYPERGSITLDHLGHTRRLSGGEGAFLHTIRPGTMGSSGKSQYIAMLVPRATRSGDTEALLTMKMPRELPAMRLLQSYVGVLDAIGPQAGEPFNTTASAHILDLLELAASQRLEQNTHSPQPRLQGQRTLIALDFIARNFRDPNLSGDSIARHQGISIRHLQRLIEKAGIRFTEHVNELRLQAAYQDLTDPEQNDRTILAIATNAGFADVSHFNRLFRRRFDANPSTVRQQSLGRA